MVELHIYRGLQGSGKTTLALANAAADGGRVVGRDHLRELMGFSGLGSRRQEEEVTEIQGRLIQQGLRSGQNVHVDDMNLKSEYVRRLMTLAERSSATVQIHDLSGVDLQTCIDRDRARGSKKIGEDLIRNNWIRFIKSTGGKGLPVPTSGSYDVKMIPAEPYVPDTSKPEAILVDLDGTLALKGNRGIHDYDERVFYDLPNTPVIEAVQSAIQTGKIPIYLSGRKGYKSCRTATHAWITQHVGVSAHWLYMRAPGDNRPDFRVKRELFNDHVRLNWNVRYALDDRQQVVDMYREMGITVFQVAPGNF